MKSKFEIRPISEIKVNLFVRTALNDDHAIMLAQLLQNGVELPAIKITPDGTIIDGRHRLEAHDTCGHKEIACEVVEVKDEIEMISLAFQANLGGSLPPSTQDTEHTIKLLLERNEPQKNIAALLNLPPSMAKAYVKNVQSKISRQKMQRAVAAVTDGGQNVVQAAEEQGIDPERLKEVISGKRRQSKRGVAELQGEISTVFRSKSSKTASILKRLFDMYEDGDVTHKQVEDIITHIKNLNGRADRVVADWESRFASLKTPKKS